MTAKKDEEYIRFRCDSCGQKLKVRKTLEGGSVVPCPKCGSPVNVPLANIEAIAKEADMAETGAPGRIKIDAELLLKRLQGQGEKAAGPGSVGGPPTLRQERWSPQIAFGRIQELDQLAASLVKISDAVMGEIQRIYRDPELKADQREGQLRQVAERRKQDIGELLQNRLASLRQEIRFLQARHEHLMRSELDRLEQLKKAHEAVQFYGRYILGIEV